MELTPIISAFVCNCECDIVKLLVIVQSWMFRLIEALANPCLVLFVIRLNLTILASFVTLLCRVDIFRIKVKFGQTVNDLLLFLNEVP